MQKRSEIPFPVDFEYSSAQEVLEFALAHLTLERKNMAEYVRDLEDQLIAARLLHSEAVIAERAIRCLLGGDLFTGEFQTPESGAFLDAEPEPEKAEEPQSVETPEEPVVEVVPEPVPEATAQEVEPEAPEPVVEVAVPAPEPVAQAPSPDETAQFIADCIDLLWATYPGALTAKRIALHIGMKVEYVYPGLRKLEARGVVQWVMRKDKSEKLVLRPGEELPTPELTDNQAKVYAFVTSWCAQMPGAYVRAADVSKGVSVNPGSTVQILDALVHKGFLESKREAGRTVYRTLTADNDATPEPQEAAPDLSALKRAFDRDDLRRARRHLDEGMFPKEVATLLGFDLDAMREALKAPA